MAVLGTLKVIQIHLKSLWSRDRFCDNIPRIQGKFFWKVPAVRLCSPNPHPKYIRVLTKQRLNPLYRSNSIQTLRVIKFHREGKILGFSQGLFLAKMMIFGSFLGIFCKKKQPFWSLATLDMFRKLSWYHKEGIFLIPSPERNMRCRYTRATKSKF